MMNEYTERFRLVVAREFSVSDLVVRNDGNPFALCLTCDFPAIGRIIIEPFQEKKIGAFRDFYERQDPEWDLSAESRSKCDQHDTSDTTLAEIVGRVSSEEDARFVILTRGRVIGYILIEEIGRIKAGEKTFFGEHHYAELDIAVSDRFHGIGLGSFAMLFLKLVAAIAGVGLGLVTSPENRRAVRLYEKHGFVRAGQKDIIVPSTGQRKPRNPWYILERDEIGEGIAEEPR